MIFFILLLTHHFIPLISSYEFILKYDSFYNVVERNHILSQFVKQFSLHSLQFSVERNRHLEFNDIDVLSIRQQREDNYDDLLNLLKLESAHNVHISNIYAQQKIRMKLSGRKSFPLKSESCSRKSFFFDFSPNKMPNYPPNNENDNLANLFNIDENQWPSGERGKNVKIAILDTGLKWNHSHFSNVKKRIDWTKTSTTILSRTSDKNSVENEENRNKLKLSKQFPIPPQVIIEENKTDDMDIADDVVGHGTFVAGVIGGRDGKCTGLAPDADLYIMKVFTKNQISYTSWFVEAFNFCLQNKIDIINLSIGGMDFMDEPFIQKIREMSSNGMIVVSAVGNDGPIFGSINNPADQSDVIGVGGLTNDDRLASFSARGMTTWELPNGYGRVKPDMITFSEKVLGSSLDGNCHRLSGTSVASPLVTGIVALLLSYERRKLNFLNKEIALTNVGKMKQCLMNGAERVIDANLFEQGAGRVNVNNALNNINQYIPQVSIHPSYLDFVECPFFWPHCLQPLYATAIPVKFNFTILNGIHEFGFIKDQPKLLGEISCYITINYSFSHIIWPYSGWLSIEIKVKPSAIETNRIVNGNIELTIESNQKESFIQIPIRLKIIPTPNKKKRILWDQFHSLRYPPGYFPRDDLLDSTSPLDVYADHLHTNFKDLFQYLRNKDYFIEILNKPFTKFNAKYYSSLIITDNEDEFLPEEIVKLYSDIRSHSLSLLIFADWYNLKIMSDLRFFDEHSGRWWLPDTGGANIPALNDLLKPFDIQFDDSVISGYIPLHQSDIIIYSGTTLQQFPEKGKLLQSNQIYLQIPNATKRSDSMENHILRNVGGLFDVRHLRKSKEMKPLRSFHFLSKDQLSKLPKRIEDKFERLREFFYLDDQLLSKLNFLKNDRIAFIQLINKLELLVEENPEIYESNRINKYLIESAILNNNEKKPSKLMSGRIAVFGDSTCIDSQFIRKSKNINCFSLFNQLLVYVVENRLSRPLDLVLKNSNIFSSSNVKMIKRPEWSELEKYSKTLKRLKPKIEYLDWKDVSDTIPMEANCEKQTEWPIFKIHHLQQMEPKVPLVPLHTTSIPVEGKSIFESQPIVNKRTNSTILFTILHQPLDIWYQHPFLCITFSIILFLLYLYRREKEKYHQWLISKDIQFTKNKIHIRNLFDQFFNNEQKNPSTDEYKPDEIPSVITESLKQFNRFNDIEMDRPHGRKVNRKSSDVIDFKH
ncbi:hypothetical protein SNEBB_003262 [Seison nebaliae]|nr:hypothetical protein SNEBB_003262 [Seison nebaliae]